MPTLIIRLSRHPLYLLSQPMAVSLIYLGINGRACRIYVLAGRHTFLSLALLCPQQRSKVLGRGGSE